MPENNQSENNQIPRHRHIDHSVPVDSVPTQAECDRPAHCGLGWQTQPCPRHNPTAYADAYARHATDSNGLVR